MRNKDLERKEEEMILSPRMKEEEIKWKRDKMCQNKKRKIYEWMNEWKRKKKKKSR